MSNFPARELAPLPPPPPWGRLADEGRVATVIRFVTPEATYSWPLHGLLRWEWKDGDAQTLTIFANGAAVTINGRRLEVLRDALDAGRLERVQVMSERSASLSSEPLIRGITVATR